LSPPPVVVEKPFTPTSKEAYDLTSLAEKQQKLLTVYQNRRWDADFLTLSKCIKNGSLGRVVDFETHFDRHRPEAPVSESWKYKVQPGGGAIYDLGTHLMDQVVCLFGPPTKITAFVGSQRDPNPTGFQDSCTIHMHYDGMMATARASVVSLEVNQLRFWVRGDKGSFKKFHMDCQEEQLRSGTRPGDSSYGLEPQVRYGVLTTLKNGTVTSDVVPTVEPATYAEFYRKLAKALAGDTKQLPVDPSEAALVIRLVELALESSRSGRTIHV
jgi:predicted dehydrogenase